MFFRNRQIHDENFRMRGRGFTLIEVVVIILVMGCVVASILPMFAKSKHGAGHARIRCVNNLKQVGMAFKVFAGDNDDLYPFQTTGSIAFQDQTRAWIHFQALSNELLTAKVLLCPEDRTRSANQAENFNLGPNADPKSLAFFGNFAVSFFVGIHAGETNPAAVLSGDRNIGLQANQPAHSSVSFGSMVASTNSQWSSYPANKIHEGGGNLLIGDGSVQQASVSILQNQLKLATDSYGSNANRFVFPQ